MSAGTYLALASLTQQVEAGCQAVDVLGTVLQLRARRPKMVQTQEQYTFLYQVQYSAVQYSTVQYSAVQCSTVQYRSVRCKASSPRPWPPS